MIYKIGNYCQATCRRNCKYIFGSFFVSAHINQKERVFDIKLYKTIKARMPDGTIAEKSIYDFVNIEKYKQFWGPQWRIQFITAEEA